MEIKNEKKKFQSFRSISSERRRKKEVKIWTGSYFLLAMCCLAVYIILRLEVIDILSAYHDVAKKIALGGFFSFLILLLSQIFQGIIAARSKNASGAYNLIRFLRLCSVLLIVGVFISLLFENWYAAAVSLGLISLILGFALQTPISSFIGWIYILVRAPYHVGDRIQLDTFKGDVVEISYFDTTLWEFGGDYLTNDLPSGRLIRFPNSLVLEAAVFNYSWKKFPYIWNEIPFHLAYESDLEFIESSLRDIVKKELGNKTEKNIKEYKELLAQTPVDETEIKEYPYISFRINTNTWVEVVVTYLVEPKRAAAIRSNLIKKCLKTLVEHPEQVMFPKSNAR